MQFKVRTMSCGKWLKCKISGHIPDLQNQKLHFNRDLEKSQHIVSQSLKNITVCLERWMYYSNTEHMNGRQGATHSLFRLSYQYFWPILLCSQWKDHHFLSIVFKTMANGRVPHTKQWKSVYFGKNISDVGEAAGVWVCEPCLLQQLMER